MNDIEFLFIGWCHEQKNGVDHDKVWCAFKVGGKFYAGWGRRDKKLRFKLHDDGWSLRELINKKRNTYKEVDSFRLFSVFPYFKDDVSKYLSFDILTDSVM